MATTAAAALSCSCSPSPSPSSTLLLRRTVSAFHRWPHAGIRRRPRLAPLHVVDDSKEVETRSETDRLVDGLDFGELCNDFECISSPYVESTARQIARDILEIRQDNRALSCYAVAVKYKDPLRSFVGREKYKRPLWITEALEKPTVTVQEMSMQSTSTLTIKWTLRGKPKNAFFAAAGGELVVRVDSQFVLNQISGQVLEHVESWDLSAGTFDLQLDTPGLLELPHALSSSIESNGSEVSTFLADVQAVSSASTLCSTFQNVPSYMEPVSLEAFSFQGIQNAAMFNNTSHSNGNLSVFDEATMASLPDSKEFLNGSISSFGTAQQSQLAGGGLKAEQQEQNTMCNIPHPSFVSGSQMAVSEAQGALIPSKITSMIHNNKSEYPVPISHSADAQHKANSANGNSGSAKPRTRARRGQATDPHSIAERLRREKISERMKNLQDLVPNSNKADKSSMLDEIIDYVKFLQLQVKVLSMSRLGAPGAVLPLLAESQTEGRSNSPLSSPTASQGLLDVAGPEDSLVFEQEVIKLMETSITNAMQYLQNKGLCLMPIALASAISNQKGTSAAAIPPER